MKVTYVACTWCNNIKIPVALLIYRLPSKEFPDGSYEGKCNKCSAKFEYEANYIKTLSK